MTELDLSAMRWRKSTHSSGQGGECIEVAAARWRKSSHSAQGGDDCVEVAGLPDAIAVRDSKDPDGAALTFPALDWAAFVGRIKTHALDG